MISGQLIVDPAQIIERAKNPKLIPSVLEPRQADWTPFDAADRDLLGRLLRNPVQYMDCPVLHKTSAERTLFGAPALLAAKATRFTEMPIPPKNASGIFSAAQERVLFEQLNYVRMRKLRILSQFSRKRMPVDKLRLLLAWGYREIEIRTQIVEPNMPLVLAMIRKSHWSNMDYNDLISEGSFALLRCVDKFDCCLGFKFSTYACRAILKGFARVGNITRRYRMRFPTMPETGIEPREFVGHKREYAETMCMDEVRVILSENRADLDKHEQIVICERFLKNPDSDVPHPTLAEVGTRIGVSKERVRQIQNKALFKLRNMLEESFVPRRGASSKTAPDAQVMSRRDGGGVLAAG
jgi:RNA polymerase sigma factor (sigma-70 family)